MARFFYIRKAFLIGPVSASGEVQKLHALPGFGSADFGETANWREQGDPKTNFSRKPLIGKVNCMAPFTLRLDLFRVGGKGAEKNLSAVHDIF